MKHLLSKIGLAALATILVVAFAVPSFAGLSDDARHVVPGHSYWADVIQDMIETACPIRDEDETITGVWTFTANPLLAQTKWGTVAAGTDDERPVFSAPFNCELISISVINVATIAASTTAEVKFDFQDKGSDGTGTTSIVSLSTDTTSITAFNTHSVGTLGSAKALSSGDVVSLKTTHDGAGTATDEMLVVITYKRTD